MVPSGFGIAREAPWSIRGSRLLVLVVGGDLQEQLLESRRIDPPLGDFGSAGYHLTQEAGRLPVVACEYESNPALLHVDFAHVRLSTQQLRNIVNPLIGHPDGDAPVR